ncbi:MAG: phosphocholine cytidylyltransferase family protein [Deltaproteobacteria bacterium]|nr:phosphocholine cytidylyltransferase family protein [Deltaproteobacteria bacterium]
MRAIIIGAGRGSRLMPLTRDVPKCFAEVGGRRILDWALAALREAGIEDIAFIGGYCIDAVKRDYPELTFRENDNWPNNNILQSLMYARDLMSDGFICSYADILYRPRWVRALLASPHPIALACDSAWRLRYQHRSEHPEDDAEKVAVDGDRVLALNRTMSSDAAAGEYIGVARFNASAARAFIASFDAAKARDDGGPYKGAKSFAKAYLIDHFQQLLDEGHTLNAVLADGGYMEIDTQQDYELARKDWQEMR